MKFLTYLNPKYLIIFLVKIYQFTFSQLLLTFYNCKCRFTPSCSCYMIEALQKKGLIKGLFMGISRLLRCHPFSNKSGFDPVK